MRKDLTVVEINYSYNPIERETTVETTLADDEDNHFCLIQTQPGPPNCIYRLGDIFELDMRFLRNELL